MLVEAHISEGINSEDVPSQFLDITLASAQVSRGPFSIQVPKSRDLMRAERLGNGWVNFSIVIDSGDYVTSQYIPVPMASRAANGSQPAAQEVLGHAVTVPHFRSFRVMNSSMRRILTSEGGRPDGVVPCEWLKYGSQREDETRIGEVHTDTDSGSTDEFKYATQADSTITVGVSASASSGWSGDGSVKISNHFGGSGSFPNPAGTLKYADGDFYYQRYESNNEPDCPGKYMNQAVSALGDAFRGTNSPAANPYGGCLHDPHGQARADPHGGTFDQDRGTAEGYSGIANVFGFSFGGGTGFSNNIYQDYTNNSNVEQYYCGNGPMPDVPVIYNSSH